MPDLRQLGRIKPPLTARWLLRLALPRAEREFFMGDLEEEFFAMVLRVRSASMNAGSPRS